MQATTAPPVSLHPVVERVLDYPFDPLRQGDICEIFGVHRETARRALKSGAIENSTGELHTGRTQGNYSRRTATKSAVLKWLWDSHQGERAMMRAVLAQRAPAVLAVLESGGAATPDKTTLLKAHHARQTRAAVRADADSRQPFFSFISETSPTPHA